MKVFLQRSPATAFAGLAFNHYSCFFVLSIYIDLLLSTGAIFAQEMNIEVVVVENGISHCVEQNPRAVFEFSTVCLGPLHSGRGLICLLDLPTRGRLVFNVGVMDRL